jgi:hypothetical protein
VPGAPYGRHGAPAGGQPPTYPFEPAGPDLLSAPHRRSPLLVAGIATALALGIAASVVNIIAWTRPVTAASVSTPPSTSASAAPPVDVGTDSRALCSAISTLMAENDKFSNTYAHLGDAGTPARDAATPQFIADTKNWITRIQPILDQHPNADPFLRRTLQRFIDDQNLIVLDLQPGPLNSYWKAMWSDSLGAYAGPLLFCKNLDVKW